MILSLPQENIALLSILAKYVCSWVVTIEAVLKICCPNVNFIDIFASYMKADFKRNFNWHEEFNKFKRDSYLMLQKSMHIPEQLSIF